MTATRGDAAVHWYAPYGACKILFESRASEILLSGPAGTGKSRGCLEKIHILALKYPGARFLLLRKTAVSLTSSGLVTWERFVVKEALAAGLVRFFGGSQREAASYRYTNGSVVVVGGLNDPNKIMSTEYDVIYVQEAIELTVTDWENCTTRLRNGVMPYQQLIADTNPSVPTHWLKQRSDRGTTMLVESRHEDNPTLWDRIGNVWTAVGQTYMRVLDALTGVRFQRLRRGLWVAAEGLVYDEWDPAIHLIDPFEIPSQWTRRWAVDFGYTNPFVLQWWAEDPDGRLYLYREIYQTKTLVEDHARAALAIVAPGGPGKPWIEPRPRGIVCDHDAEDRATLERHIGLGTIAASKSVSDGIQAVAVRLRAAGDGKPRLFAFRDALVRTDPELVAARKPTCTAEEMVGYVWPEGPDGKPVKEAPVKVDDHGADTMRYLVMDTDLGGSPRVRWF